MPVDESPARLEVDPVNGGTEEFTLPAAGASRDHDEGPVALLDVLEERAQWAALIG